MEAPIGMSANGFVQAINGRYHRVSLRIFMVIVFAHLAEHIAQAIQIYALGWEIPDSRGILGLAFPWLVTSEAMHYGYAILMLIGLILFRPGFVGVSRTWWNIALGIQIWHHFEHALLLGQAVAGTPLFGQEVSTSVAQLVVPRVELHLLYNTLVLIPMLVAMVNHMWPSSKDRAEMTCSCAVGEHHREKELAHSQ
ncbi:MAG: hypothetical protein ACRDJ2_10515 [Actinomycetota bacterium]